MCNASSHESSYRSVHVPILLYSVLPFCQDNSLKFVRQNAPVLNFSEPLPRTIYLKDCFILYEPIYILSSSVKTLLQLPQLSEARWMTVQERAFSVMPPKLWNSFTWVIHLPPFIRVFPVGEISLCHLAYP